MDETTFVEEVPERITECRGVLEVLQSRMRVSIGFAIVLGILMGAGHLVWVSASYNYDPGSGLLNPVPGTSVIAVCAVIVQIVSGIALVSTLLRLLRLQKHRMHEQDRMERLVRDLRLAE